MDEQPLMMPFKLVYIITLYVMVHLVYLHVRPTLVTSPCLTEMTYIKIK